MPLVTVESLRKRYPQLEDASDTEIAQLLHQAVNPKSDYRVFEYQFLGKPSAFKELGRGIKRGARYTKAGLDFLAGGVASVAGDRAGSDEAFASYDRNLARANRIAPRRKFRDVRSVGDGVDWAAGLVGEALPTFASAGLGPASLAAMTTTQAAAYVPDRVEYLMPGATAKQKALAAAGMVMLNGAGDAFVPTRLMRGGGGGVRGLARTMKQGAILGAATPLAERAIAVGAYNYPDDEEAAPGWNVSEQEYVNMFTR